MEIQNKLSALRNLMQKKGIDAFVVYSADPHLSEYMPKMWQERSWISGFTGSAGFAVILENEAGLWTDSRYFVQAEMELKNSGFTLFKEGVEGTPLYTTWLTSHLKSGSIVGVSGLCTSQANWQHLETSLKKEGIVLKDEPLLGELWQNRPAIDSKPIFVQPIEWAGESPKEKISRIREQMHQYKASTLVVNALDEVAWSTNLRGADVEYNPVFMSYMIVDQQKVILFADKNKCSNEVQQHLKNCNIELLPYDDFFTHLAHLQGETVLLSPQSNQRMIDVLREKNTLVITESLVQMLKAVKNNTELAGFRAVMKKDGVAMVKFLHWLSQNIGKTPITEYSLGRTLEGFRAEQPLFVGNSFGEIVGFEGNGAIVHYSAKEETAKELLPKGSVLIDSGGQYREGTTDITRVAVLGELSDEFKTDYTLVLKGMINLSMAKFPKGTRGVQLDALARLPLWHNARDYGHGTGHGVGCFLNVHEGPQNIRKDLRDVPLVVGMVCSNEPGLYREGKYGIRIENLIAVQEETTSVFGSFYSFETLTLCPINTEAIKVELLSEQEKNWLNTYHARVWEELNDELFGAEKQWLKEACKAI